MSAVDLILNVVCTESKVYCSCVCCPETCHENEVLRTECIMRCCCGCVFSHFLHIIAYQSHSILRYLYHTMERSADADDLIGGCRTFKDKIVAFTVSNGASLWSESAIVIVSSHMNVRL